MALWFKRKKEVQSLPANIHDASSATIEKKSGQWLEEINSIRLAQAEAELEAAKSDKPLFYLAAERLAKEAGKTREALLEEYAQHLRESKYPTPECLRPDEIQIAE